MKQLDKYFKLQNEIYSYFGYKENWKVIPISDCRKYFWYLDECEDHVHFADTEKELKNQDGNYYECEIFTYCHLDKYVYRGKDFTMICVDTNTDGNKFLQIFSNENERGMEERD